MPVFQFPSVRNLPYRYTAHSDSMTLWNDAYRIVRPLGPCFGFAYGPSDIVRPVSGNNPEIAADYLASLAAFVIEQASALPPDDARDLAWIWPELPSVAGLAFALSVRHREGVVRYFNLLEAKISKGRARQHDKRWHEIRPSHDGTVWSAIAVLRANKPTEIHWLLETWVLHRALHAAAPADAPYSPCAEVDLFGLSPTSPIVYQLEKAFDLAHAAFTALRARFAAENALRFFRKWDLALKEEAKAVDVNVEKKESA